MKIKLSTDKVRDISNIGIAFLILYNCIVKFLIFDLDMPGVLNYVQDIMVALLFLAAIIVMRKEKNYKIWPVMLASAAAFWLVGSLAAFLNHVPVVLYLWGLRKHFRFFLFFFSCLILMKKDVIPKIFRCLYVLLGVNLILVTYTFFFNNPNTGDLINGLFGWEFGGNSFMNSFLCIIYVYATARVLLRKCSWLVWGSTLAAGVYIATLAEIKLFYLEVIAITLGAIILNGIRGSAKRAMLVAGIMLVSSVIAIKLLYQFYPNFDNFFSKEYLIEYSSSSYGYYGQEAKEIEVDGRTEEIPVLGRTNGWQIVQEHFLDTPRDYAIGKGFGYAEESSFSFFTSDFFEKYKETNYQSFLLPFYLLETGWLGMFLYLAFYGVLFCYSIFNRKKSGITVEEKVYFLISELMVGISMVICINNSAMIVDATAYIVFWGLSFAGVAMREEVQNEKILFVVNSLRDGGAEKILLEIVKGMDKTKFDISVLPIWAEGVYLDEMSRYAAVIKRLPVIDNKIMNSYWKKIWLRIFKIVLPEGLHNFFVKQKYDVEVAFIESVSTKVVAGSKQNAVKKLAWVHTDLENHPYSTTVFGNVQKEKEAYKQFGKIFCVSKQTKEAFERKYGVNACVQHNPIDYGKVIEKSKQEININFQKDCVNFVAVGRLVEQKGFDRLIRAVSQIVETHPSICVYILGEGIERKRLEQMIKEYRVEKQVVLLGFQSNPYPYICRADVFISSSRIEGYSTVIMEALLLEKPIIATECAGARDLLGNSEYGFVVDNTDDGVLEGMKKFMDTTVREKYKNAAQQQAKMIMLDNNVKTIENIFME